LKTGTAKILDLLYVFFRQMNYTQMIAWVSAGSVPQAVPAKICVFFISENLRETFHRFQIKIPGCWMKLRLFVKIP